MGRGFGGKRPTLRCVGEFCRGAICRFSDFGRQNSVLTPEPGLVDRVGAALLLDALLLLRQAERAVGTGDLTLTARGAVIDYIAAHAAWIETLQNRIGRAVRLAPDPAAKGAGHAQ